MTDRGHLEYRLRLTQRLEEQTGEEWVDHTQREQDEDRWESAQIRGQDGNWGDNRSNVIMGNITPALRINTTIFTAKKELNL